MGFGWWRWWRGGAAPDADALLGAAAIRFDFSQYTDTNDMIDVNGGWGPIDFSHVTASTAFTADGLRIVNVDPAPQARIENVPSDLLFSQDGMSIVGVLKIAAAMPVTSKIVNFDLAADGAVDYAPELSCGWGVQTGSDTYAVNLYDLAPGYATLVSQNSNQVPPGINSDGFTSGVWVMAIVVDPQASEMRVTLVIPQGELTNFRFDDTIPFSQSAEFAGGEFPVDTIYYNLPIGADFTLVELIGANRAYTPGEVDALVEHFVA